MATRKSTGRKATSSRPITAPAKRAMPSHTVLRERAVAAMHDAYRAERMLRMLQQLADSDRLDVEDKSVIDGIGDTLELIAEIVSGVADQLDSAVFLAPEARS